MVMSFMWQMCGVDMHCDTEIGRRFKALAQTLTSVTGDDDIANLESVADEPDEMLTSGVELTSDIAANDEGIDETDCCPRQVPSEKPQNLEKEMWKQGRKVNLLR